MSANAILRFEGPYRFLSNFVGEVVDSNGRPWKTVEHAYQAAKTLDRREQDAIMDCATPGQAKRMGRRVHLRDDWELVKLDVMEDLVYRKFSQSPYLSALLLATYDLALVEGNTWGDRYWGVCGGCGENHLGKILMKVRSRLREKS